MKVIEDLEDERKAAKSHKEQGQRLDYGLDAGGAASETRKFKKIKFGSR